MIKAGLLGLGWWGKLIIKTLENSNDIRVVAASSRSKEKHQDFLSENKIIFFDTYQDMLKDGNIDAIIICTPNTQHEEQVLQAINANKQVFCEKPMTLTKKSAEKIIQASKNAGLVLGIGHERRFDPAMERLKSLIEDEKFGEKMHIEANWSHDILAALEPSNWRGSSQEAPAGGMTGTGVHMTDLFISMFGSVDGLFAQSSSQVLDFETGDLSALMLKFKNGATGQLSVISKTPYYCRISAFGDKMWAEVRDLKHPMYKAENELTYCLIGDDPVKELFPATDTIKRNLEDWSKAIRGKLEYRFTDDQKIENVAILEAMDKSIKNKDWVKL